MSTQPPSILPTHTITTLSRFSDTAIQAQIDRAVALIPPDKTSAIVLHGDLESVSLTAVVRVADGWSIDAGASYRYGGAFTAEAQVVKVF
jgi:hypothetical protein